jgi:hypothetical protein
MLLAVVFVMTAAVLPAAAITVHAGDGTVVLYATPAGTRLRVDGGDGATGVPSSVTPLPRVVHVFAVRSVVFANVTLADNNMRSLTFRWHRPRRRLPPAM